LWQGKIGTGSGGAGGNGKLKHVQARATGGKGILEQVQEALVTMDNWNRFRGPWWQWKIGTGSGATGGNGKLEQVQGKLVAMENWNSFRGTGGNGKLEQVQGALVGGGGGH